MSAQLGIAIRKRHAVLNCKRRKKKLRLAKNHDTVFLVLKTYNHRIEVGTIIKVTLTRLCISNQLVRKCMGTGTTYYVP